MKLEAKHPGEPGTWSCMFSDATGRDRWAIVTITETQVDIILALTIFLLVTLGMLFLMGLFIYIYYILLMKQQTCLVTMIYFTAFIAISLRWVLIFRQMKTFRAADQDSDGLLVQCPE